MTSGNEGGMPPSLGSDLREIRKALRPTSLALARRCAACVLVGVAVVVAGFPWLLVGVAIPFLAWLYPLLVNLLTLRDFRDQSSIPSMEMLAPLAGMFEFQGYPEAAAAVRRCIDRASSASYHRGAEELPDRSFANSRSQTKGRAAQGVAAGPSRRRGLLTLAGAATVVGALIVVFNWWLGATNLSSDEASTTSSMTTSPPPPEQVPLGVEMTDDGQIKLHVPECPAARVTAVGWSYFPKLATLWSIDRNDDGPTPHEFTVGVAPPGFSTYIEFSGRVDEVPHDVPLSFVALRSTASGESLPAATATLRLDELSTGSIRYHRVGESPRTADSAEGFQAAVGC